MSLVTLYFYGDPLKYNYELLFNHIEFSFVSSLARGIFLKVVMFVELKH